MEVLHADIQTKKGEAVNALQIETLKQRGESTPKKKPAKR